MFYYHERKRARGILWAIFWIFLGAFLLLSNYGLVGYKFSFSRDWPILLVALGIVMLIDRLTIPTYHWPKENKEKKDRKEILLAVERGEMSAEEAAKKLRED
ncbi:MAG: DUF5668 domain-containing protein [Candidatus Edwardsbacteria bacterium]